MAARLVEVVVPALASLPGDVVALAALLVLAPLLGALVVALAVLAVGRRVARALPPPAVIEPTLSTKDPVETAYEAVRDWYGASGDPAAEMMYMLLEKRTKRHG